MAYMRGNPYIYESEDGFEIEAKGGHVTVESDTFRALCIMVVSEMSEEEKKKAVEDALSEGYGNCSCDALAQSVGLDSVVELVKSNMAQE